MAAKRIVNFFLCVCYTGLAIGVPTHLSLLATMTLGPLGLLLHTATLFMFRQFTGNPGK